MWVETSTFENVRSQMKQIWVNLTYLRLCVAVASHNFKWMKFVFVQRFDVAI